MIITWHVYKEWVLGHLVLPYFHYMKKINYLHVHYLILKQWQSIRIAKALWKLKQKLKFHKIFLK